MNVQGELEQTVTHVRYKDGDAWEGKERGWGDG